MLLKGLAVLPLSVLYLISDFIYLNLRYVVRYRKKMILKNLRSSFPNKDEKEIKEIMNENYRFISDIIVETVKLLHISDEEMMKRVKVMNAESVNETLLQGKNTVLFLAHYGNWEWVQEITRYFIPDAYMASIYHPLHNKTWDDIFLKLRGKWGAHIIPQLKAVRTLLERKNMPWVCGFIADHRPTHKNEAAKTEFLNHVTYFIDGPEQIGRKVEADFFFLEMRRIKRGHYTITFFPLKPADMELPYPYSREFWKRLQSVIDAEPAFWLWSHNRWKGNN